MNEIEDKHVLQVYNNIFKEFNHTRNIAWPCVREFIMNLPTGSLIGDIGCGNGRHMVVRDDCLFKGCDFSSALVKLCKERNLNVIEGNILNIPFDDNYFDHTICIAVLHHLSTEEHRLQSIKELIRVTKSGGKLLILVWALEQSDDSHRKFETNDNFVDWKTVKGELIGKRYCHVFNQNELEELIYKIHKNIKIKSFYEEGNWGIIIDCHKNL